MKTRKEIEQEIKKTETEITMSDMNDGWWNKYMEEKLKKLKKLLEDDNSRVFDEED
jgi:hypothetical protein